VLRLLDLFCGAGGCARGYQEAGFHVTGVDSKPQPRYAGDVFVQGDALEYVAAHGREFDVIHASPPCQAYTSMRHMGKTAGQDAPDLVAPTREALRSLGSLFVIENVVGAPVTKWLLLCGSMFGLGVMRSGEWQELRRHRLFESNFLLLGPRCQHRSGRTLPVWGDGRPSRREARKARAIAIYGDHPQRTLKDVTYRVNRAHSLAEAREAMGIDWMEWREITQAIPPAYTRFIGEQLLRALGAERQAA
jgi:DNA (cytosine-5)-methyltransferase 1